MDKFSVESEIDNKNEIWIFQNAQIIYIIIYVKY